jgi:hypothetical protein
MKRSIVLFAFVFVSLIINYSTAKSLMGIGFFAGLSTPNDQINNVYNSNNINIGNGFADLLREGTKLGYHLGLKGRLSLADNVAFTGSAAWHRFPDTKLTMVDPDTKQEIGTLVTSQDIIPITAGINYYLIDSGVGIYGTGELSYNYFANSVSVQSTQGDILIPGEPDGGRVGFGIGAGIDINLVLVNANLEAKYNVSNLIGKSDGEQNKAYYTLSLGIFFGG